MRLENLYENFGLASPETQAAYIASYRLRRAIDLSTTPPTRKSSPAKDSKFELSLTDEEKALIKILGLKPKDLLALRMEVVEEETDNGADLFKDKSFEEDED
jgi:hypothetical protein